MSLLLNGPIVIPIDCIAPRIAKKSPEVILFHATGPGSTEYINQPGSTTMSSTNDIVVNLRHRINVIIWIFLGSVIAVHDPSVYQPLIPNSPALNDNRGPIWSRSTSNVHSCGLGPWLLISLGIFGVTSMYRIKLHLGISLLILGAFVDWRLRKRHPQTLKSEIGLAGHLVFVSGDLFWIIEVIIHYGLIARLQMTRLSCEGGSNCHRSNW